MKKPAFCIIGAKKSDNTKDLFWAAKKGGYECAKINISNMLFENEGRDEKFIISCDGKNLLDFDIFIFRSYSKNILEARILIDHLAQNKKTILDAVLAKKYVTGKMHEASIFANAKISYLRTIQALEESVWEKNIEKLKFPIIVKPIAGSQGKDVQKINTKEEAINFFQEN